MNCCAHLVGMGVFPYSRGEERRLDDGRRYEGNDSADSSRHKVGPDVSGDAENAGGDVTVQTHAEGIDESTTNAAADGGRKKSFLK